MGNKGGRYVRLKTLPPSCAVVIKSVNFKFLEPSAPVQACNGTDLSLHNVHIQLSCVCNRPCCFRNFGIQRHFV